MAPINSVVTVRYPMLFYSIRIGIIFPDPDLHPGSADPDLDPNPFQPNIKLNYPYSLKLLFFQKISIHCPKQWKFWHLWPVWTGNTVKTNKSKNKYWFFNLCKTWNRIRIWIWVRRFRFERIFASKQNEARWRSISLSFRALERKNLTHFLLRFSWCASNFSFFKSTPTHFGNRVGNVISFRKIPRNRLVTASVIPWKKYWFRGIQSFTEIFAKTNFSCFPKNVRKCLDAFCTN